MNLKSNIQETDTSACDKEPVSFIASIQPHAAFFSYSKGDLRIHNYSENIAKLFGQQDILLKRVGEFDFGKSIISSIEFKLRSDEWETYKEIYFKHNYQDQIFEVHVFEIEGLVGCEVESLHWFGIDEEIVVRETTTRQTRTLARFKESSEINTLGKELCHEIRQMTGLDRVMLYRFSPVDWHGVVIAEDKTASAHSFLGHRFPASDIPKPARDLYLQNKVRYIADSSATASAVKPALNSVTGKTINLSNSKTRAVSPIHLEYLQNMGVKTSYSVAITVNGELWGLVACHASRLVFVTQEMRLLSENIAEAFAIAVPLIESNQKFQKQVKFTDNLYRLMDKINNQDEPLSLLFKNHQDIFKLFDCDGMAMIENSNTTIAGFTPLKNDLLDISQSIQASMDKTGQDLWSTDSLSELDERWASVSEIASGVLAIRIPQLRNAMLMLFRKEMISSIIWGGDPRKLEGRNYQGQINPRKSFESWEEIIKSKSQAWGDFEKSSLKKFKSLIFDLIIVNNKKHTELEERLLTSKK